MLPGEIPKLSNIDIAVYMKTATEVGGDYYDFNLSSKNTLTVVLGDATGHGLNAGMLVSVTKGLFQNIGNQPGFEEIILKLNASLISMNLQPMFMSLCLVRIQNYQAQIVGAGMPPLFLYSNQNKSVEEIESSGPPLGGFLNFNYKTDLRALSSGDVLVLMSDGFAERMNEKKEIFGWDKGSRLLAKFADHHPDEIIRQFISANNAWGGNSDQTDDITIVVLKAK